MVTPSRFFENDSIYHIVNRGVEKRPIFEDRADYGRFERTLSFYQQENRDTKLSLSSFRRSDRQPPLRFEIIAYCLMSNHFHLLLRQLRSSGISSGVSELCNSYTKYFNTRHKRIGPLFQGTFKAVPVRTDEQFVHVCRYIFLNPVVAGYVDHPSAYRWSSYRELTMTESSWRFSNPGPFLDNFTSFSTLEAFVLDHVDYARSIEAIKHLTLD